MTAPATTPNVRIIGRYALHEEIAAGGMATVHLGRLLGPAGFSRTVAIKRLHAQYARDPEFTSMFLDEARLAARIRHPNVVSTLDVVALDGELFIVMDYVEGESLSKLIRTARDRDTRIPTAISIAVMAGVLYGLHGAHEAKGEHGELLGLVHRDVSPQNILVDTDGVPRVVDFGVAKAVGRLQTTRDGQLKGKLAYMAPEQLRGQKVDARTDIFAASVVLWELLAGKRLFQGENEADTFGKILECDVPPPSTHAVDVPPEIDAIVMRGLSPKADGRWEHALDMAEALERASRERPTQRDVGRWVRSLASDSLTHRAAKVRELESHSAVNELVGTPAPIPTSSPLATVAPLMQAAPATVVAPPSFDVASQSVDAAPAQHGAASGPHAAPAPAIVAAGPMTQVAPTLPQSAAEAPAPALANAPVGMAAEPDRAPRPVHPTLQTMVAAAPPPPAPSPDAQVEQAPRPPESVLDDEPTLHSDSKSIPRPALPLVETTQQSSSQISSVALERMRTAAPPRPSSNALIPIAAGIAGVLALALLIGVVVLVRGGTSEEEPSVTPIIEPVAAGATRESADKASSKRAPATPAAPAIVEMPSPSAMPSAAPAPPATTAPEQPATTKPAPNKPTPTGKPAAAPATPKMPVVRKNCNPPYTLDKDGTRIPKPECL